MTTVSKEKWDTLTPAQQEMMSNLGITPKTPARPKTPKVFELVEYYLKVKIYCQLCRATTIEYYHMNLLKKNNTNPFLHGDLIDFAPEQEYKLAVYVRPTCRQCYAELSKWSRDKLVRKVIETWPAFVAQTLLGKSRPKGKEEKKDE